MYTACTIICKLMKCHSMLNEYVGQDCPLQNKLLSLAMV